MILKIMIVVGYLAICSLLTSTWVDRVEGKLIEGPIEVLAFIIVFLLCPFVFLYHFIRYTIRNLLGLGDKNVGD